MVLIRIAANVFALITTNHDKDHIMEEKLSLFSASDVERYINDYAIPWGINILMAIAIYVIGRIVVGFILSVFRRLMAKSKYDNMLVDFLEAILSAILMLFVIVASLDQLGVDTTSLVAILGAAGLAIGLSLQDSLKNFAAGVMLLVFKPFKAGDFVEAMMDRPQESGVTRVLSHSIVWQYIPEATRVSIEAAMAAAAERASAEKPLAWVALETNRETFRHELHVRYWPGGGEETLLGCGHPHGAWAEWFDTP